MNNPPLSPLPAGPGPDRGRGRQALTKGEISPPFIKGREGFLRLDFLWSEMNGLEDG